MRAVVDILSVCAHVVCGANHVPSDEKSKTGFQERNQLENMRVGSAHKGNSMGRMVRLRHSSKGPLPLL